MNRNLSSTVSSSSSAPAPSTYVTTVSVAIFLLLLVQLSEAIFFPTVGLTGLAASSAIITQPTALLPVLGLLALAAKVTKLKLDSQNQGYDHGSSHGGYGSSHGGYGYSGGHGHGGHGHGGHGHGGYVTTSYVYPSSHHISSGYGHGGGHISSGYGGHHSSGYDRKGQGSRSRPADVVKSRRQRRQKRNVEESEALEEIFGTLNILVRYFCKKGSK